jgi:hypothetical protein
MGLIVLIVCSSIEHYVRWVVHQRQIHVNGYGLQANVCLRISTIDVDAGRGRTLRRDVTSV